MCPSCGRPGIGSCLGAPTGENGRPEREDTEPQAPTARSARVIPPWLTALRDDCDPAPGSELLVYRRPRPFDPSRFGEWLKEPPLELIRGKGRVWLASDPARSFGYSCAGSVHRLFPAGRWWAASPEVPWPSCAHERGRLLARWHPRFGDRRQDLVFVGVDLDAERLCAGLDACLEMSDDAFEPSGATSLEAPSPRLH